MWTKLGSELLDAFEELPAEAAWLHIQALLYSNRAGLDLDIPKRKFVKFAHTQDPTVVDQLVGEGWWEDRGSSYYVGCYRPEWQLSADVVEHRRQQNANRQERKRRHDAADHSMCTDRCPEVTREVTRDVTRYPVRVGTDRNGTASGRKTEVPTKSTGTTYYRNEDYPASAQQRPSSEYDG
ncbi:hypothetical protein [Pseudonocardia sediminis]|uniref:hypothetical protein n=1 Tax=Pseudonocardia sediminis TaxID=1397368 RepID=UPI001028D76E|nr:hypothetical protein [Pseudonocardia sediminis]